MLKPLGRERLRGRRILLHLFRLFQRLEVTVNGQFFHPRRQTLLQIPANRLGRLIVANQITISVLCQTYLAAVVPDDDRFCLRLRALAPLNARLVYLTLSAAQTAAG